MVNSRYLMYEAQQAHYFGLNLGLAIASVTTTPANAAGVGWRVGKLEKGGDFLHAIFHSTEATFLLIGYDAGMSM